MYQPTDELLREVTKLSTVQQMKATVNQSVKSGALVGAATILSGILGGPRGMMLGGIVSSCIVGYCAKDQFKSVPEILLNASPEEKEKLANSIRGFLSTMNIVKIQDIVAASNKEELIKDITQIIIVFLANELNTEVSPENNYGFQ